MYRVSQQVLDKNFEEKSVNVTKNEKVKILSWNQNKNKKLERWLVSLEFTRENNQNKKDLEIFKYSEKALTVEYILKASRQQKGFHPILSKIL